MFSIHGLVRGENLELGRDADTGGQVFYVVELARALSNAPGVERVDLVTRRIVDRRVSEDYGVEEEFLNKRCRIVRVQCGGRKYIRKELLWPHLDEFVDKTVKYLKRQQRLPDWVHGHYPDAGYVAMQLASLFRIPFVYTGHSLGRAKLRRLLEGGSSEEEIDRRYKIHHRIKIEEEILKRADQVIASTEQEVETQWGAYDRGRNSVFQVIPPGVDVERFYPYSRQMANDVPVDDAALHHRACVSSEMQRFLSANDRPLILSLCRPDRRKNIRGLIDAYGQDRDLQAMANLAIFAGIRKDIASMNDNERDVLTEMLLLMDKYDLYGKMAVPKRHDFDTEVPELYRLTASRGGVFVNCALIEPFGLTLIESSSCGLPVVATEDGGPRDIIRNCQSGILVNPTRPKEIARAIKTIIRDPELWRQYSRAGIVNVRKHYTWASHAKKYLETVRSLCQDRAREKRPKQEHPTSTGRKLAAVRHALITDIDDTLIGGDPTGIQTFCNWLENHRSLVAFGVATGRSVDSATAILQQHGVPAPDIMMASVGSEIYYGPDLKPDQGWASHISHKWHRDRILELLRRFDGLEEQETSCQRPFKVSFNLTPSKDLVARIHTALSDANLHYQLIVSHGQYLDILPARASKGRALRYLAYKWEIPLKNFLVCGDSGNDEDMLRGASRALVVGNHRSELSALKGLKDIYFARAGHAEGIMEGIQHYGFPKVGDEE